MSTGRELWDSKWRDHARRVGGKPSTAPSKVVRLLLDGLPDPKSAVVLDIGCGTGIYEAAISDEVGNIVGIDISKEAVAQARGAVPKNVDLLLVGGTGLQFISDSTMDMVFSFSVFQHLPARLVERYLRESHRVLKPRGLLKCQVVERAGLVREGVLDVALRGKMRLGAGRILEGLFLWGTDQQVNLPSWPAGKPWSRRELSRMLARIGFIRTAFERVDPGSTEVLLCTAEKR